MHGTTDPKIVVHFLLAGKRFCFQSIQTFSGSHPASYSADISSSFTWDEGGLGVKKPDGVRLITISKCQN